MERTAEWQRGFPPDDDVEAWEVYFSPGGIVWHRPKPAPTTQETP